MQALVAGLAGFCAALLTILIMAPWSSDCGPAPIQPASIAMLMGPEL